MSIRIYNPYTSGTRHKSVSSFEGITSTLPEKSLLAKKIVSGGRNNRGVICTRHRGGGHKQRYRIIDFKRRKCNLEAEILTVEYDPNRNARISLVCYIDGEKNYILHPKSLLVGSKISSGQNVPLNIGNSLPLKCIPLGSDVHNIEIIPGRGGRIARSAGSSAQIVAKDHDFVTVKLPSGEVRMLRSMCYATIGQVDNIDHVNIHSGKAGRSRWLNVRPTVRGVAMNPCDHPHGGGEGRSPIGRPMPVTPWGKTALGLKTRSNVKYSDFYIIRRRP